MSKFSYFALALVSTVCSFSCSAQDYSIAREWNELTLEAIRNDFDRPPVHTRNLYHVNAAAFEAWAVYDEAAANIYLGNTISGFEFPFEGLALPEASQIQSAQEEALSYAVYRIMKNRYSDSPGWAIINYLMNTFMTEHGYPISNESVDYINDGPAAVGNYIASLFIEYGMQDGSNQADGYASLSYESLNPPLDPTVSGNDSLMFPNSWQPTSFLGFIDSSGQGGEYYVNLFHNPEWGNVLPFALTADQQELFENNGNTYKVYLNQGGPPLIDTLVQTGLEDPIKWGHTLNMVWSSMLTSDDGVLWDISPGAIGGLSSDDLPESWADYAGFYNFFEGGDGSLGHVENPSTDLPYEPQWVLRGNYVRSIVNYWTDSPDSESQAGYWFLVLNQVSDHPDFEKKWQGEGEVLDDLEWDVKSYLALAATLHDASIAAWSHKGFYDYVRPISLIRWMASRGQSSDENADNYHPGGLPLIPGYIETVEIGDTLAGDLDENVGKIKMYSWKGPSYIDYPFLDVAGVDWILAEDWWTFQRPPYVQPSNGGYVSAFSALSKSAAEVLTLISGDPYFPGGLSEFVCPMNDFLVVEQGPSEEVTLQWATYHDAADQCALSRIWAGTTTPAADIDGRRLGLATAELAMDSINKLFALDLPKIETIVYSSTVINDEVAVDGTFNLSITYDRIMDTGVNPVVVFPMADPTVNTLTLVGSGWNSFGNMITLSYSVTDANETLSEIGVKVTGGVDLEGAEQEVYLVADQFIVDTENPMATMSAPNTDLITDATAGYMTTLTFSEAMDMGVNPMSSFPSEDASNTLAMDGGASTWSDNMTFNVSFMVTDANEEVGAVDIAYSGAQDAAGNAMMMYTDMDVLDIDTKNPGLFLLAADDYFLADNDDGNVFSLIAIFDEPMDMSLTPAVTFPDEDPSTWLTQDTDASEWINSTTYVAKFDFVASSEGVLEDIDVMIAGLTDLVGNMQLSMGADDHFDINTVMMDIEENGETLTLLTVYPNPVAAGQDVTIQLAEQLPGKVNMQIYTLSGQVVRTEQFNELASDILTVNTAGLAAGMYFIHLHADGAQAVFQLEVAK